MAGEMKELGKADKIRSDKKKRKQASSAFPFCSVLKGWEILFSLVTNALQHWLRKPNKSNCFKQTPIPRLLTPPIFE